MKGVKSVTVSLEKKAAIVIVDAFERRSNKKSMRLDEEKGLDEIERKETKKLIKELVEAAEELGFQVSQSGDQELIQYLVDLNEEQENQEKVFLHSSNKRREERRE